VPFKKKSNWVYEVDLVGTRVDQLLDAVSPHSSAATKSSAPAPSPEGGILSSTDAPESEAMSDSDSVAEPAEKVKRSSRKASEWTYY
jgi:hypothetical protein